MRPMKSIQSVLPHVLSTHRLSTRIKEFEALTKWGDAVGEAVGRHATAVDVRNGRLLIRVDHPIWSHQLSLLKPSLLARLHAAMGTTIISDIHFSL